MSSSLLDPLLDSGWELEDDAGVWRPDLVGDHTRRWAADLERWGLAGRRILVPMANGMPEVIAVLACLRAGCLPILAKPFPPLRFARLQITTGAAAVVRVALAPRGSSRADARPEISIQELAAPAAPREESGRLGLTTSGTTGSPKVVVHTFDRLLWNARAHAVAVGLEREDRLFISLPCAHAYALVSQLLAGLRAGCHLRLASGLEPFPEAHLQRLGDWQATCSAFTPRSLIHLLSRSTDLPACLRWVTVGSDRLPPHWHGELQRKSSDCALFVTYGFSEAGPRVLTLDTRRCSAEQLAGAGRPLAGVGTDLRPFRDVPSSLELWVRTDSRMEGYLDDPRATRESLDGEWLRSRDSFRCDEEGVFFFLGRLDDAVTVDGLTFFPSEVEKALESHPRVGAARVGPLPEGGDRAVLKAWVHVAGEADGSLVAELRSFLASRVERIMVPEQLEIVDAPAFRK